MPEQTGGEKVLPASPRKITKAREEGRVARSQDLSSAWSLCIALLTLYLLGSSAAAGMVSISRHYFQEASLLADELANPQWVALGALARMARILLPFLLVMLAGGLAMNLAQVGFLFAPAALTPRFERLNPFSGFQKFLNLRSFIELVKSVVKLTAIGAIVYVTFRSRWQELLAWPVLTPAGLAGAMASLVGLVWLRVVLAMLVLGILDYGFQRWQYLQELRMTVQEAREEMKEIEGDPRIRQRIRQIQRQMAMQRMMRAVPEADVIVTNPTHVAVALRYNAQEMEVPVVTAKGARLLAERIRALAEEHEVPIVQKPDLARMLYRTLEVGQPVPENLFVAVAEILAFVFEIDRRAGKLGERSGMLHGLRQRRAAG
ncbi:MAG TPA: flagellar biosynthesis protein FlhB [Candidatus Hydrogenedentes bacterium]|jgi:flagellar biosynthetic protein FlhB|nr:flagellar biosynthesis protein FlhB [Candidatus Hydrogenedentota bacterium]HPJ98446.1 flagellar biosynthesis protein FlhB [Candidatus Hydrogenedentota bacterium]